MSTELAALNKEIHELNAKRDALMQEKNETQDNFIRSLEWTRNFAAKFVIHDLSGAGMPKYEVIVYGRDVPKASKQVITIMGDNRNYEYNISYGTSFKHLWDDCSAKSFYTSSSEMLLHFLKQVTFKSFEYDTETLDLLTEISHINTLIP
tara:strand:+ start:259 stop:708 length:450 start_codon:yes stop_codon:yes gene_type:complete